MAILEQLSDAILKGDRPGAQQLTTEAIEQKIAPQEILDTLISAMDVIGQRFQQNEIFVPEMLVSAAAMKKAMEPLEPKLIEAGIRPERTAVIGTVAGDLHDIGKNLVATMWRGAKIDVIDLGVDVNAEKFIEAAKEHNADLVGMSALLTTTMTSMKTTIEAIRASEVAGVKVMVGGAPVTQDYSDQVGADGYADDAGSAVTVARQLLGMATS